MGEEAFEEIGGADPQLDHAPAFSGHLVHPSDDLPAGGADPGIVKLAEPHHLPPIGGSSRRARASARPRPSFAAGEARQTTLVMLSTSLHGTRTTLSPAISRTSAIHQ